ncbi:MAG TPA: XdhC/CoxI family protein [Chloroflexota bacterium]|nr:XdhC/CoxI family protein [Chloroflexota bacterium]
MTLFDTFRRYLDEEIPVALATRLTGEHVGAKLLVRLDGSAEGDLGDAGLTERVRIEARDLLRAGTTETRAYDMPGGLTEVFIESFPVPPRLLIVGATGAAGPLATFGQALGYRVIIVDARAAFADPARYPDADRVLKGWPQDVLPGLRLDESTYVVLLSHDPKFDEPTLDEVLPSPVPYIGAIGSRKTQRERFERLRAKGYSEEQLSRIYGPVGLDLGGRSAEETALAILAEITAVRYGAEGGFMRRRLAG